MMNKTLNFFKLSSLALLAMGLFTFGTCSDDDEEEGGGSTSQKEFAEQGFTVRNATFHSSPMPKSTTSKPVSGVSITSEGQTATITIVSDVEYSRFYLGVEGKTGYLEYTPTASTRANLIYNIPLTFGVNMPEKMTLLLKGLTKGGDVTAQYSQTIEPFGGDIGTNNIEKVKGVWRYEYEQDDDMGTVYMEYKFLGSMSDKVADFTWEEYDEDDAWRVQVEGQYKLKGSTLRLYFRRARQKTYRDTSWGEWKDEGYAASLLAIYIDWQKRYNSWMDYVEQAEGNEVWECIVNDAKTEMQWRMLQPIYDYDPISGEEKVSYTYKTNVPVRHLKKV